MHFHRTGRLLRTATLAWTLGLVALRLDAAPSTAWTFTKTAQAGENGFTRIDFASVNAQGVTFIKGRRSNNDVGLFLVQGITVTPVAINGAALSGGFGTVNPIGIFQADPLGRVVFVGDVLDQNNVPTSTAFRWDNGTITKMLPQGTGVAHLPTRMTSDGRWLTNTATGDFFTTNYLLNGTQQFHLTDGITATDLGTFTTTSNDSTRDAFAVFPVANISGALLIGRATNDNELGLREGLLDFRTTFTSELRLMTPGNPTPTLVTQASVIDDRTVEPDTMNGTLVDFDEADLNDAGVALFKRAIYTGGARNGPRTEELVLRDAVGEQILAQVPANGRTPAILGARLDDAKRVAYTFAIQDLVSGSVTGTGICAGPDPFADRILSSGDTLFGQTLKSVQLIDVAFAPGASGDRRVLLFIYTLQDDTRGIGTATTSVTRWTSAAGGPWSTAGNWTPATVPGATTATVFDLEGSYDVTVGTRTSGRSAIESGSVAFRSADLTLTGPFAIGDDAILTQPEGKITAGELTIGSLAPTNPLLPPTAHFNLSNQGTEFITTGPALIGAAGKGELFISDAFMTTGEVRIGAGSSGVATAGSSKASWLTGNIAIGFSHPGTLNIERGALVRSTAAVIGAGTELKDDRGKVTIDNAGAAAGSSENWNIQNDLTIGSKLPGHLVITNGGLASVGGSLRTAFDSHRLVDDALIDLIGRGTAGISGLFVANNFELSAGASAGTDMTIFDGAELTVLKTISLAHASNSVAVLTVDGVNANGARSRIVHGGATGFQDFIIGHRGRGPLTVRNGARVETSQLVIGDETGSIGELVVEGKQGGQNATVFARTLLAVGGSALASTTEGVRGFLTVQDGGVVETDEFIVGTAGRVRGNGTIQANSKGSISGTIEPGSGFAPELEPLAPSGGGGNSGSARGKILAATAPILPGTLTIQGNVTLSSTGKIELDVNGSTASGAADKLVVNGALTLGGTVVLNFNNGYAPRAGDTLDLVSATSVSGAFATTTITGLAPGFQFTVAPIVGGSGGVRLTALNNAVAATAIGSRLANLSVRTPLANGQNLIVGFVVQGGAKSMLVRAAGPGLAQFLAGTHPDPRITLFDGASVIVDANDNWPGALAPTMQALSAFPFTSGSNDAALQRSVAEAHTAHVNGPGTGIVLVELYDAAAGVAPRLVNVSARNQVGTGDGVLIAGFVIEGTSPKTVLIRGIGPGLTPFGVPAVLADPLLRIFNSASAPLTENDNWPDSLADTFTAVSAFALPTGSKDAALLITLDPGTYTALVSGADGGTGEALVELYEVP